MNNSKYFRLLIIWFKYFPSDIIIKNKFGNFSLYFINPKEEGGNTL